MSEQGGPYGPGGQGQPGPGRPQGWQQPGSGPTGPQGWQQPGPPPSGPQGWQGPPPTGPQGWQQPGGPPNGPQGWQQGPGGHGAPIPQGYGPPPTQAFPGPNGPGQPFNGQQTVTPQKNRTPIIITAVAVVVALIAAAGVYFFAIRDTSTSTASGQASPQESVTALFTTLSNSDPIGLADQLDPAEAALFTDLNADIITELKRLEILSPEASTESMTGTTITVSGLTFDGTDEVINDNLRIVKLTGGTVTVASDPNAIPLSDKFKETFGAEIDQAQPESQTINIADVVAENDGEPVRVATVQRDGMWYVSLFYTIADNAVHEAGLPNPTAADFIEPVGSASPEAAVQALIDAATAGNLADVIAVLPPDEMGVLHDYGQVFINAGDAGDLGGTMEDLGFTIDDVSWAVSDVTGGKKVSLASITVTAEGQTITLTRDPDAGSVTLTVPGQPEVTLDQDTIDTYLADALGTGEIDQQGLDIIKREFSQLIGLGFVTVEVDGQYYVSPIRSAFDVVVSLMKGLEPGDIDYLISLSGN
jgi:hypothetical protein